MMPYFFVMHRIISLNDCANRPIPPLPYGEEDFLDPTKGWKSVPVVEGREQMVKLERSDRIIPFPAYFFQDVDRHLVPFTTKPRIPFAPRDIYVRERVHDQLLQAANLLPPEYLLLVFDGYRLPIVQYILYKTMVKILMMRYGLSEEIAMKEAQKYVSLPSINPPSPHFTGGAVDVGIFNPKTDSLVNMGVKFDDMSARSALRYFEEVQSVSSEDIEAKINRRWLYWVMREVGFHPWPFECWHFDSENDSVGAYSSRKKVSSYGFAGNLRGEHNLLGPATYSGTGEEADEDAFDLLDEARQALIKLGVFSGSLGHRDLLDLR